MYGAGAPFTGHHRLEVLFKNTYCGFGTGSIVGLTILDFKEKKEVIVEMTTVHVHRTTKSQTQHGRITHFTSTSKNIILILTHFNVQAKATCEYYLYPSAPFSLSACLSASFKDTVNPPVPKFFNFGFHFKLSIIFLIVLPNEHFGELLKRARFIYRNVYSN